MAKSYQMLYKCRLCGQVFVNCGTGSKKVAEQSTLNEVLRASGMSPMWKDLSWDNLERVKVTIICEAMALVLSGEYEEAGT